MDADTAYWEIARMEFGKNARNNIEQILEATFHETTVVRPPTSCLKKHPKKTNKDMRDTVAEARTKSSVTFSYGPRHMDEPVLDNQEHTYTSSVWTQDVVWRICRERWMIGMICERDSGKSLLAARLDDDDDDDIYVCPVRWTGSKRWYYLL